MGLCPSMPAPKRLVHRHRFTRSINQLPPKEIWPCWVDAGTDIEAPVTQTSGGGVPERLEDGNWVSISGLTQSEINARMGTGELDGVPGTFSCDRAGGGTCPAFGGTHFDPSGTDWIFIPQGITTTESDNDYLVLGTWEFYPSDQEAAYAVGAFADGGDPFEQDHLIALTGSATYEGLAGGMAADGGSEELSYFDADVTLTADFGDGSALGAISGRLHDFTEDGAPIAGDPELMLNSADIGDQNSGFFSGTTSGTFSGSQYSGTWGGQFFGNGESASDAPGSVAGTFGAAATDGTGAILGAFGAYHKPPE